MDSCFPGGYGQESVAECGGEADDWGHGGRAVAEWRGEGVFSGDWAGDGEGGAGECGDVFGRRGGAYGYE